MSDVPEDDTIRVRRSWPGHPPSAHDSDDIDEVTEVSRRRISSATAEIALPPPPARDSAASEHAAYENAAAERNAADDTADDTAAADSSDLGRDDEAPLRHRATYIHTADPVGQTDGSTIVARRESRRRATRGAEGGDEPFEDTVIGARRAVLGGRDSASAPTPSGVRTAHGAGANEVYPIRHANHIIAEHLEVGTHPAQPPVDGAAAAAARRRAARRTTVIVVTSASIVVLAAAAALIGIVLSL